MNRLFLDTSFFVAFLNPADDNHDVARDYMERFPGGFVTTLLILVELGNYLSRMHHRRYLAGLVDELRSDRRCRIVPTDGPLLNAGLRHYSARPDQKWSFTDCTSFIVMRRERMTHALTTDHHFEQAGFVALLTH